MTDILIIEDDHDLGILVKDFLIKEGFSVELCPDAEKGLVILETEKFRHDEQSMLKGYETGADDYIEKPFSIAVLTAKIRALL